MHVTLSEELELKVPTSKAWALFSTKKYKNALIEEKFFEASEFVEGDGGTGTLEKVTVKGSEFAYYKYTLVDNMNKVKEVKLVEGGLLDHGFNYYKSKEEIKENPNDETGSSCIFKLTRDYEVKDEFATNTSIVTNVSLAVIGNVMNKHLFKSN
ncbi:putative (S)-norcoclaurine synthase [Helianthus annuus]|uniref:(S)-norcoclaurine synthase n=1 Tax=Helianthus annuus TaxID=4232 RepID=A0A251SR48_HELAN|nr:S-norcoclaurine synthase [Helianthus annuus]KAF5772823.1 putative (S)-norcoclaurine synthase [Helianthus annuus]KAJ0476399.1 putative (S)-norcoclaurine synthase [Helianthus annuus]KAJ0497221.1 putative (S)-norcoclaurine synthase [Helianthus annuus]KAJ0663232.1 putative (S)-norcoclaurine synthase [Helianthus annuus]KAJ0670745.1 putative (S)-norcoclaurine synthase [Helianthus annuus]